MTPFELDFQFSIFGQCLEDSNCVIYWPILFFCTRKIVSAKGIRRKTELTIFECVPSTIELHSQRLHRSWSRFVESEEKLDEMQMHSVVQSKACNDACCYCCHSNATPSPWLVAAKIIRSFEIQKPAESLKASATIITRVKTF